MPNSSSNDNLTKLITVCLTGNGCLSDVLAILDEFATHPFDTTNGFSRASVDEFLGQISPRLPSDLHERILLLTDCDKTPDTSHLIRVTKITPSMEDPHNITRFLADGGIGRVWVAEDEHLGREVVLKQLLPISSNNSETRAQFVHEAQITGQLQHPNIVTVYSMDHDENDAPFYTMRYIRGDSFKSRIKTLHAKHRVDGRSQEFYNLVEDFFSVCNAVAYAHSQGIAHCDLKPENIAVGQFGEITVLDWGLAHRFGSNAAHSELHEETISGTPNYLSPEQARGVRAGLTPATDIYSLGAILFEILFNRPPRFTNKRETSLQSLLNSVMKGDIPKATEIAPRRIKIIASICDKCLATLPEERYPTVQHLIADLHRWRNDEKVCAAPNTIARRIGRTVRRHQRTTLASLFLLTLSTIFTFGFYTNVISSREHLRQANHSQTQQQIAVDREQIALTQAIAEAIDARQRAESGERSALLQTKASANAIANHKMARKIAVEATTQAMTQERKAISATAEAIRQSKQADFNRDALDRARTLTEELSQQRQLNIETGYTDTAMQLAEAGDLQTALGWAVVARNHAQVIRRGANALAEHQARIMAIQNRLPALIGYMQFPDNLLLTAYSQPANTLAVVTRDQSADNTMVELLHANTLKKMGRATRVPFSISKLVFSPDGTHLIITGISKSTSPVNQLFVIKISDLAVQHFSMSDDDAISALLATNNRIIIGTNAGRLNTYKFPNISLHQSVTAHREQITSMSLSPDLRILATSSSDTTARLWELDTLAPLTMVLQHKTPVVSVRFSKVSNRVITTAINGFSLSWDSTAFLTKARLECGPNPAARDIVSATSNHPSELLFATGTEQGDVHVYNAPGSDFIAPMSFNSEITTLGFSADARLLVIGTADGMLSIYDFSQRRLIYDRVSHQGSVSTARLSRNNRFLTVTTTAGKIVLWDLAQSSLAPVHLSAGANSSQLRLTASKSALLFVSKPSTIMEVSTKPNFPRVNSKLNTGSPIKRIFLSPCSEDGIVITQQSAQQITTSPLKLTGSPIIFAGDIIDTTTTSDGTFALSSRDRTVTIGRFNDPKARIRITSHKSAAQFIRLSRDLTTLFLVGAMEGENSNHVLQTVAVANNTVLKRVITPFDIRSVAASLLPNSNDIAVTTSHGDVYLINVQSLEFTLLDDLGITATRVIPDEHFSLLLGRDDTILDLSTPTPKQRLLSNFQTVHTSFNKGLNWILRASDFQFTLQSASTGHQIIPPITVASTIQDVLLMADGKQPLIFIATTDGVFNYTISPNGIPEQSLSANLALISGTRLNDQKQLVPLTPKDITNLLIKAELGTSKSSDALSWLRRYSTSITSSQWRPYIDQLRLQHAKLPHSNDNPIHRTSIAELRYALLASGNYEEAISLLRESNVDNVKATYQAVVLSAWHGNSELYNRSIRDLLSRADPSIPQHFVYLLTGLFLAPHNLSTQSLVNALNRLPERLSENPYVQRGQLQFAIFRNDRLYAADILAKMDKSKLSLPLRIYAQMARTWIDPELLTVTELQQFRSKVEVLPALESGNPGKAWEERCLLDIMLRQLQTLSNQGQAECADE